MEIVGCGHELLACLISEGRGVPEAVCLELLELYPSFLFGRYEERNKGRMKMRTRTRTRDRTRRDGRGKLEVRDCV